MQPILLPIDLSPRICRRLPAMGIMAVGFVLLGAPAVSTAQTNAPLTGEMTRPVVRQVPTATAPAATPARAVPVPAAPTTTQPATVVAAPATAAAQAKVTMQSAAAASPAPAAPQRIRHGGGASTRTLLAAQASGRIAGPERPVLGVTASLAWERYVNSFKHPIPEWFDVTVEVSD